MPVYPKPGRGRRPYPLRVMLRIHCLQLWFNLSDPGMEQCESPGSIYHQTARSPGSFDHFARVY